MIVQPVVEPMDRFTNIKVFRAAAEPGGVSLLLDYINLDTFQVSCDWWRGGHVTAILISIGHLAALATQSDPGQDGPGQRLQDRWQQFLGLVRGRLLLSQKQTSRGGIFHSNII